MNKTFTSLLLGAHPALAYAAQNEAGGMATLFLSLLLILCGFVLIAWLARRYLPGAGSRGVVKVVGATLVGARERVVVIEVDNSWLLLGVGGGQVRLLDKMPKPVEPTDAPRETA